VRIVNLSAPVFTFLVYRLSDSLDISIVILTRSNCYQLKLYQELMYYLYSRYTKAINAYQSIPNIYCACVWVTRPPPMKDYLIWSTKKVTMSAV